MSNGYAYHNSNNDHIYKPSNDFHLNNQVKSILHVCASCDSIIDHICKMRNELPLNERINPILYECHNCKILKCNNCIKNIYSGYDVKYKVPNDGWMSFLSRRALLLHSCSQKCYDAYEEMD